MLISKGLQEIWNIIKWWKIKIFCCHMLSHTVRKPCATATVKLNPIKRSANKAGLGVCDLVGAVPARACQHAGRPALWLYCLCSLPMDMPGDILERKQQILVFSFLFSNTLSVLLWGGLNLIPITSSTNNELFKINCPVSPTRVCTVHMFAFPTHVRTKMEKLN